uniref:Uncharacterized protein n=1 Tax=Schistocephalus solidus TaxID=70667 RepID=A0A0X3NTC0_SCHSO
MQNSSSISLLSQKIGPRPSCLGPSLGASTHSAILAGDLVKQVNGQAENNFNHRYSAICSPPAKRGKSSVSLTNVAYEDETCMGCFSLQQKFSGMEQEIRNLRQEIDNLKKSISRPTAKNAPVRNKPTTKQNSYSFIASSSLHKSHIKHIATAGPGKPEEISLLPKGAPSCPCATLPVLSSGSISTNLALPPIATSLVDDAPTYDVEEVGEFVKPKKKRSKKNKSCRDLALACPTPSSCGPTGPSELVTSTHSAERSELQTGPRLSRKHNLVIKGVPESASSIPKERVKHDLDLLQLYAKTMLTDGESIHILKAYRIGKALSAPESNSRPRPLKIILENEAQAQLLLQRKATLRGLHSEVFFQPEYGLKERLKMRQLIIELETRRTNGEAHLQIRNGQIVQVKRAFLWPKAFTLTA